MPAPVTPPISPTADGPAPAPSGLALLGVTPNGCEWVVPFRFRAQPRAVGAARRVLHEWEAHFDAILFYDLSLCVSELVTHSVQHGDHTTADCLELTVRRTASFVRAEVSEPRIDLAPDAPAAMVAGDWGMFIVDRVADRWGVDHAAGTLVWCEIDLSADSRSRGSHHCTPPPR